MNQIFDRLWLGSYEDALAVAASARLVCPITAILTLCEACPDMSSTLLHFHTPIPDAVYLPREIWGELLHALTQLLHSKATVLVHCREGVSRSPSLVAAYLAQCGHSRDPQAALAYLVTQRSGVAPHAETWRGVTAYWEGC